MITIEISETVTAGSGSPVQYERTVAVKGEYDPGSELDGSSADATIKIIGDAVRASLEEWEQERRLDGYKHLQRNRVLSVLQLTMDGQQTKKYYDILMKHTNGLGSDEVAIIEKEFALSVDLGKERSGQGSDEVSEQEDSEDDTGGWPPSRRRRGFKRG